MKKKLVILAGVLTLLFVGYFGVNALFATTSAIPTARVDKGEFEISLNVNGEVDARGVCRVHPTQPRRVVSFVQAHG